MTKLVEDLKQLVEIKAGIDFDGVPYYLRMAKELEAERDRLRKIAERLEVLAVKWVDAGHHDWPEIKKLSNELREGEV